MKYTLLILALSLLMSCHDRHSHHDKHGGSDHHHNHSDGAHHKHGTANDYMHQSSVEDLIERFESADRDAYQKPDQVIEYLGDIQGKKVLDLGAGSGYFSVRLAAQGASVIAADVNEEFQAFITKRIQENKLTGIEPRKIPYDDPGLAAQEVDMVLIVNTYHHIENRTDYFTKVKAGLKPDGALVVIDFFDFETPVGPEHHKVSIDTVIDELRKAGFTTFSVNVDLLPYQYCIKAS